MKSVRLVFVLGALGIFGTMVYLNQIESDAKKSVRKIVRTDSVLISGEIIYENKANKNLKINSESSKQILNDIPIIINNTLNLDDSISDLKSDLYKNPNKHILKYVSLPLDTGYGSNAIPLVISALMTQGDMLELGMGMFSTPILSKIAIEYKRKLISVDTEKNWVDKFIGYNSTELHKIYLMSDYRELSQYGRNSSWGIVLVDHFYATARSLDVISFANNSQIVLAHDAEKMYDAMYRYDVNKVTSYFKYGCKFSLFREPSRKLYISTIILSNFIDLNSFKPIFDLVKSDYGHVSCDMNL